MDAFKGSVGEGVILRGAHTAFCEESGTEGHRRTAPLKGSTTNLRITALHPPASPGLWSWSCKSSPGFQGGTVKVLFALVVAWRSGEIVRHGEAGRASPRNRNDGACPPLHFPVSAHVFPLTACLFPLTASPTVGSPLPAGLSLIVRVALIGIPPCRRARTH